mgnify:CR=1 FL=1
MRKPKLRLILNIIYFSIGILIILFSWLTNISILSDNVWFIILFWSYVIIFNLAINYFAPKQKSSNNNDNS